MSGLEWLEALSDLVAIVGLPLAISVFIYDCQREDFRNALPPLLVGEYPEFVAMIGRIAGTAAGKTGVNGS